MEFHGRNANAPFKLERNRSILKKYFQKLHSCYNNVTDTFISRNKRVTQSVTEASGVPAGQA